MRAKRRFVRPVTDLASMTNEELVGVYFFGTHPSYPVQPDDWRRAHALLRARGWKPGDRDGQPGPEAA